MAAMSIVVAVSKSDRVVVAGDSLVCFGDAERIPPENSRTAKIMRLGSSIMGGTGWAVFDDILRDFLHDRAAPPLGSEREIFSFLMDLWKALHDRYPYVNDQAAHKDTPFADLDSSFVIANRGGIFKVSSDMGVTRFNEYYAIGCGAPYALGALRVLYRGAQDADAIAREAVQTAIDFDVHCGGPIELLEVADA